MVTLTLTEKGGESKQLTFEKEEVTVGRVQGNDIVLPKGNVSKRHCRILLQNGRFSVEDLKSTNGTYINGRKIGEPTLVSAADKIYVGDFIIKVENAFEGATSTPGVPEAGSLSTALPRRPPPPPAPGRPTGAMRAIDDDLAEPPRGRSTLPPPPPPPARRDTGRPFAALEEAEEADLSPPSPAEVDLDEESLAPRPRLAVPPLKSALASLTRDDEEDEADRVEAAREQDTQDEPKTANRERVTPSPVVPAPVAARTAAPPSGSPDAVATWLKHLIEVEGASAVYVTGNTVEIDRDGRREPAEVPAGAAMGDAIRALASRGSPRPGADTRVVNVTLPENARLAAIFPPVASETSATLQRLKPSGRTLSDLVSAGVLSREARELLEACINTRRNILVGGDGRGTRTLLQALASAVPENFRVVSLVEGLTPAAGTNWTRLATESRVSDIVFAATSLRPDYLVVEVTAPPLAADVLAQCVLGQEGSIVSLAARSASDAVQRLAALAGPALGGTSHVRELAASAFDVVACASTLADGAVRLLEVGEPRLDAEGQVQVEPLVAWRPEGGGRFQTTGAAGRLAETLAARGASLPAGIKRR